MQCKTFAHLRAFLTLLLLAAATTVASAATEQVIHTFNAFGNGGNPQASLIADAAGNLYGTASTGGSANGGLVFELTPTAKGQWKETILYEFPGGSGGFQPMSGLVFDKAGNLYGTTYTGGVAMNGGYGVVFELSPGSKGIWVEKIIHEFRAIEDGVHPEGNLIFDAEGNLFGTTVFGGLADCGTVFELSPTTEGWKETIAHNFSYLSDGQNPLAGVIFDAAGNLYGTTSAGGSRYSGGGTVFRLSPSSTAEWTESTLHTFSGGSDGANPAGGVILDSAGNLYGTTQYGPQGGFGVVFELSPTSGGAWVEKTISVQVINPVASLIFDSYDNLYGTSTGSGDPGACNNGNGCGEIFELSPTTGGGWKTSTLYTFTGNLDGIYPAAGLILDAAGNLYGTTATGGGTNCTWTSPTSGGGPQGCGTVFKLTRSSNGKWTETRLYVFPGTDGYFPSSGLTADAEGNLYGTTYFGGTYGFGEIFKLTPSNGSLVTTPLHSFTGGSDGGNPNGLILDAVGNLYGSTQSGGGLYSCGVVFELSPAADGTWKETVLHRFPGAISTDGCVPLGNLVFDSAGSLYGTAAYGGGGAYCFFGNNSCGAIFKLTPTGGGLWTETILHRFQSSTTDGVSPNGSLLFDSAGNLYGLTSEGGSGCSSYDGCGGTAFELSSNSSGEWTYNVIYNFQIGGPGPFYPNAGLIFDSAGNLYSTSGGGCGTVFELSPSAGVWVEKTLYSFATASGNCGASPGLTIDRTGNLYGAAVFSGSANFAGGTVYELSLSGESWTLYSLYTFPSASDGGYPNGGLVLDSAGNIYGTTQLGGVSYSSYYSYYAPGLGVVFEITP